MNNESSLLLVYRYFFFDWLYRDVGRGSLLERSAAWRYNKAHAHWLLTYLKRWVALDFGAFAAGLVSSQAFQGHWICIPFYLLFSIAIAVCSVIAVAWLGLRLLPAP